MAGVVHQNRKRLPVDSVDTQDGNRAIHRRRGNLSEVALKPTHAAIRVDAKPVVTDEHDSVPSANLGLGEVLARFGYSFRDFLKRGSFPCRLPCRVVVLNYWTGMRMGCSKNEERDIVASCIPKPLK